MYKYLHRPTEYETHIDKGDETINRPPKRPHDKMWSIETDDVLADIIRPTGDDHKEHWGERYHNEVSKKDRKYRRGSTYATGMNWNNDHPSTGRVPPDAKEGIVMTNHWCIRYDGMSALQVLMEKPKCDYEHLKFIIEGEGGYIDEKGIIHKGKAKNTIAIIRSEEPRYLD